MNLYVDLYFFYYFYKHNYVLFMFFFRKQAVCNVFVMDSCILGLRERSHVEIFSTGATTMASARDKLFLSWRRVSNLFSESPSFTSATRTFSFSRFSSIEILFRYLGMRESEFSFYKSLF